MSVLSRAVTYVKNAWRNRQEKIREAELELQRAIAAPVRLTVCTDGASAFVACASPVAFSNPDLKWDDYRLRIFKRDASGKLLPLKTLETSQFDVDAADASKIRESMRVYGTETARKHGLSFPLRAAPARASVAPADVEQAGK